MEKGPFGVLLQPAELVIIGGSALGTVFIGTPPIVLKSVPTKLMKIFLGAKHPKKSYLEMLTMLYEIFVKARKDGLVGLEGEVTKPEEGTIFPRYSNFLKNHHALSFLCDSMKLLLNGVTDPVELEKAMDAEIEIGSAEPKGYTRDVLVAIAKEMAKIPNKVIIGGHTDRRPYADKRGYTNWELSTDRANSARRVLVANGMKYEQVERIVGHADESLLDPSNPYADANRRITILVLPRVAEGISPVQNGPRPQSTSKPSDPWLLRLILNSRLATALVIESSHGPAVP